MNIRGVKVTWSSLGKLAAGIATVLLSFYIFRFAPPWMKILVLAILVSMLFAPSLLFRKKLPPELEKALRDDDRKNR